MARDALATLARLRRLAVTEARRALAEALRVEERIAAEAVAAERALMAEAEAGDPAAYAAWLPRGVAEARAAAAKAADRKSVG